MVTFFSQQNLYAALIFVLLCMVLGGAIVGYESIIIVSLNLSDTAIKLIFLVIIVGCYFLPCSPISEFEKQIVWLFLIYALGLIAIATIHDFKILFSFRVDMYWHALLLLMLFVAFRQIELSILFYWHVMTVIVLLIFTVALYASLQDINRASGIAGNINAYGKLAGMAFLFLMIKFVVYRYDQPSKVVIDLLLILMAGFGLYISETRAAWIAVLATLFVITPLLFESVSYKKLGLFIVVFSIVLTIILFTNPEITQRLAQGGRDIQQYFSGNIHTSWGYRLEMWRLVLLGFIDQPIWGHGLDSFNAYVFSLKEANVTQLPNNFGSPHNEYLHMLFSAGVVGMLLFLSLLVGLLVLLSRTIGGIKNIRKSLYARLYFSLVVYVGITCLFDTSWSNKHLLYVYVVIIIMTAVMLQKDLKFKDD